MDEYLHAEHVKTGDLIKITGKARLISAEDSNFERSYLEIPVQLPNGKSKIWTPNKTTLRSLAKGFGDDADKWVGKYAKAAITKQNVRGEMKLVLYAEPAEPPESEINTQTSLGSENQ
jgi:hypothetical protein